jgi:hypothetical protein
LDPTVGLIAGSGWAAGVNLYAVVLLLGGFGRAGLADVPELLQRPEVLAVAGVLYAIEFVVDKVPYLDDLWDVVHTLIRPTGAAVLGAVLAGEVADVDQLAAALGAGALATVSHTAKATGRLAINTSPEPASNILVSLAEDGLVAFVVWLALEHPVLAAVTVVALTVGAVVLIVLAIRVARRASRRIRQRWRERRQSRPGTW